jgi:pSer/pThr/pTyr-binding forkhead associated (FHA) protein
MSFQLKIVKGPGMPKAVPLRSEVTTIGRQEDCQVRIVSSEVSRKHCQLFEKKGHLLVKDLNSANGTFVNGKRVKEQLILEAGATLSVGPVTFQVEVLGAAGDRPAKPADTAPGIPVAAVVDEDEALALLDLDPSPARPAGTTAPAKAQGKDDEFEIDFGDDAGEQTIKTDRPSSLAPAADKPAPPAAKPAPPPAAKAGSMAGRPTPPKPAPPPPPAQVSVPTGVDEAVADFLLDLRLDEDDKT